MYMVGQGAFFPLSFVGRRCWRDVPAAKIMLDVILADVLAEADRSHLVGRLVLSMPNGSLLCAAVRPPVINWSTGPNVP